MLKFTLIFVWYGTMSADISPWINWTELGPFSSETECMRVGNEDRDYYLKQGYIKKIEDAMFECVSES